MTNITPTQPTADPCPHVSSSYVNSLRAQERFAEVDEALAHADVCTRTADPQPAADPELTDGIVVGLARQFTVDESAFYESDAERVFSLVVAAVRCYEHLTNSHSASDLGCTLQAIEENLEGEFPARR